MPLVPEIPIAISCLRSESTIAVGLTHQAQLIT